MEKSMPIPPALVGKIVQAGAGTGKTESLAREIIHVAQTLYQGSKNLPRLVATTFTERATSELRERVIHIVEGDPNSPQWLKDYVQNSEFLQISTIHGVFAKLLHRYGALLGLDPEFTVMSEDEEDILLRKIVRRLLVENESASRLVELYGFEMSTSLVAQLVEHLRNFREESRPFIKWESIAADVLAKFFNTLDELSQQPHFDLPPKLGEIFEILMGLKTKLTTLKLEYQPSRESILHSLSGIRTPSIQKKGAELKPFVSKIFELKKQLETESFNVNVNKNHIYATELFDEVARALHEEQGKSKKFQGVLSFSDLEFLLNELVEKYPKVKIQIRSHYDFWFVDEFQDTSPLQKRLLISLFRDPWNAYFVGDPQQSIYLFRGADQNVFEDTKKAVHDQGGQISALDKNYRSEADLLEFMNLVFPPLKSSGVPSGKILTQIHLRTENVDDHSIIIHQINEWIKSDFSFQDITVLVRTNTQARDIAHSLNRASIPVFIHTTGGFYDKREVWDALSILSFIINTSDNESFVTVLRSPWAGIPDQEILNAAQEASATAPCDNLWDWIFNHKKEMISKYFALSVLGETLAQFHLYPLSFVFESVLQRLGLFEYCLIHDASGKREANLRKLVSQLRRQETQPGFSASKFILQAWRQVDDGGQEAEAASFVEPRRVNIMTIHKSKGLKFICVILPYCGDAPRVQHKTLETSPSGLWAVQVLADDSEEKISPLTLKQLKEKRTERELAESHRLFYVAVTRAAKRLALISQECFSEISWMASLTIDLSEGDHKNIYNVKNWSELPPSKNFAGDHMSPAKSWDSSEMLKFKKPAPITFPKPSFEKNIDLSFLIKAQQFGVAFHYVFEEIKRFPDESLELICRRAEERFGLKNEIDPEVIRKTLAMKNPPLQSIINNGFSEWSFSFKNNGRVYSGRLDLWGEVDGKVWIVDYKSAASLTTALSEKVTRQLEFYALALSKKGFDWEVIKPVVVLPKSQEAEIIQLRKKELVIADLDPHSLDLIPDQTSAPN